MKVDLDRLSQCLRGLADKYHETLGKQLNKSKEFDAGFVACLHYVREYVVVAIEEQENAETLTELRKLQDEVDQLSDLVDNMQKNNRDEDEEEE